PIIQAADLHMIPLLVARRLHYATRTNLLMPAGIIAHESLYQYYPLDQAEIAAQVKHARSLGFTDVLASEEPHARTVRFFSELLPAIVEPMAERWNANKDALVAFAREQWHSFTVRLTVRLAGSGYPTTNPHAAYGR